MSGLHRRVLLRNAASLSASTAGLVLLDACGLVPSLAPAKVPRLGFLATGPSETIALRVDAVLAGMHDLGYVECQTMVIEWRFTPVGAENQFANVAADLARLPIDVIVVHGGTPAAQAAKQAPSTIPMVAVNLVDPVRTGLVASIARPVGNLIVISNGAPGLMSKQVDLLREVLPRLARVAAFVDRILCDAEPADLPVEQPSSFELVINRTTTQALGITIPPDVAGQVREWIQ